MAAPLLFICLLQAYKHRVIHDPVMDKHYDHGFLGALKKPFNSEEMKVLPGKMQGG